MRLRAEQLEGHLARDLKPVYAVHGDEPLLALEAADAIRAAARRQGYADREVFEAGRSLDWGEFHHAGASLSLFGGKKIVELRFSTGKVPAAAAEAIGKWCGDPNPDTLLLLTMPRPEGPGWWKSPWFVALDSAGVIAEVEPVTRAALPGWLQRRLARQKQSAAKDALDYLADRVEGNLLAAHQEVQKLALLAPEGELSLDTVRAAVADVARYDPVVAAEALLARDTRRYVRVIEGLRGEGEPANFVLFILSGVLFALQGSEVRLQKPLVRIVEGAAGRFPRPRIAAAVSHAARIDRAIKGVSAGEDPWDELVKLGLALHAS